MDKVDLYWLDTRPAVPSGVTWGSSWPHGELAAGEAVRLVRADGTPLPVQSWPLAYWPQGSIKWLGCAAVLAPGGE